jgi:hypothetical protein
LGVKLPLHLIHSRAQAVDAADDPLVPAKKEHLVDGALMRDCRITRHHAAVRHIAADP